MLCKEVCVILALLFATARGMPRGDELMLDLGDDTAVVESTVRETRAVVPEHIEDLLRPGVKSAFLHSYGDDEKEDGDVQGYHKRTQDKGSDGYKHVDSYHKKDNDKYGYEKHSEFGKGGHSGSGSKGKAGKYAKAKKGKRGNSAVKEADTEEAKNTYKVVEDADGRGGKKQGVVVDGEYYDGGYYGGGDGDSQGYSHSTNYAHGSEGAYSDGGEEGTSGSYTEGDADSGSYTEGDGYDESEGDVGYYTADDGGDGESHSSYTEEGDDGGESEAYTAEEDDESDY